jgi:hypothetical protein
MAANILLGLTSLILASSPYISGLTFINEQFHFNVVGNIAGNFKIFVLSVGILGFVFAVYNMFLRRKNGSPYIVIGVLVLVVSFFYNQETVPVPMKNTFLGGELFFAFTVGFVLAIVGLAAEWLMQEPN